MADISPTLAELQERLSGWKASLILTPTKTPKALLANAVIALRGAQEWQGVLAYDEFKLATIMVKPPPWRKGEDNSWAPQPWTDHEDALTTDWLQHNDICVPITVAAAAAMTVAKDNSFHPVRDYLAKLQWDGVERVEHFASKYLGAEDTPYHRLVSKCTLIGAVARIMEPGCKADHVMILEGRQGIGKSTSLTHLFEPWFSDEIADLGSKDAAMQLSGVWCIELAELSSMTRSEIERVKAFISRRADRFRPSYGRNVIEVPRQAVFVGTTNSDSYLRDETGGRRFLPVRCESIKPALIWRDRDQLWSEAVTLHTSTAVPATGQCRS
jgi:predicted P-loop ATPase